MIITKSWLQSHKTLKGSWTKAQAEILELEFPLRKGWQQRVIGRELSESEAKRFEMAKLSTYSAMKRMMNMFRKLSKEEREAFILWIDSLER